MIESNNGNPSVCFVAGTWLYWGGPVWIHIAVWLPFSRKNLSLSTAVLSNLCKMTRHGRWWNGSRPSTGDCRVWAFSLCVVLCMSRLGTPKLPSGLSHLAVTFLSSKHSIATVACCGYWLSWICSTSDFSYKLRTDLNSLYLHCTCSKYYLAFVEYTIFKMSSFLTFHLVLKTTKWAE